MHVIHQPVLLRLHQIETVLSNAIDFQFLKSLMGIGIAIPIFISS